MVNGHNMSPEEQKEYYGSKDAKRADTESGEGHEFSVAYDYSEITDNDRHVVDEILRRYGHPAADTIRQDFGMETLEEYDESQSTFLKAVRDAGGDVHYQGFNVENGIKYPMLGITGEIRKLNQITDVLIEKVMEMVREEDD